MEETVYYVQVRRRWKDAGSGGKPYDCYVSYLVKATNQIEARNIVAKFFPHGFEAMKIRRGPGLRETVVSLGEECP